MDKPGYKTTEFWLATLAVVVGVLMASGAFESGDSVAKALALVASVLASLGYSVSRGMAKKGPKDDE